MPPSRFAALKPHWRSWSVAAWPRSPVRDTHTMRRFIGRSQRIDSSSATGRTTRRARGRRGTPPRRARRAARPWPSGWCPVPSGTMGTGWRRKSTVRPAQITVPGVPSSVTTSRPAAAHARIPPVRLTASNPCARRNRVALGATTGAADRDDAAIGGELAGTRRELAERDELSVGRVARLPLVDLAHVEQCRARVEEGASVARSDLGYGCVGCRHRDLALPDGCAQSLSACADRVGRELAQARVVGLAGRGNARANRARRSASGTCTPRSANGSAPRPHLRRSRRRCPVR